MTTLFDKSLELLDLKNTSSTSLKSLHRIDSDFNNQLTPDIYFALETAQIFKADAVYFRHFSNGQPPLSQIYIYDRTTLDISQKEIDSIHKNLWSGHIVPIFIVVDKLSVRIFDSRSPIESDGLSYHSSFFEKFQLASTVVEELEKAKKFSSTFFDNGTFWENEYGKTRFGEDKSVYYYFIAGLKKFRKSFNESKVLEKSTTDKLLVLSILIKYLEERGDSDADKFANNFFIKKIGVPNFSEAIRKGKLLDVFELFSTNFNGKIFEWTESEKIELKNADLSQLANFLDSNISDNSQYLIWRQYSFEYLPVELISNVYEEFLGEGSKDVVYTPKFLADLLINETMPLDKPQHNFKIMDVSCGSGIFLVSAFKRLVEWWRIENNHKIPEPKILFQLLRGQIFGVDIDPEAARLSIFSLCLALCDKLTPRQIWEPLRFFDLSEENVLTRNFFKFLADNKDDDAVKFDLIIGNPPFNPPKRDKNSTYFNKIKAILPDVEKVPDDNLALLFLTQAMRLVKKDGQLCLIVKSAPLLYNFSDVAIAFRKSFFERYNVNQILDFTNLKKVLFGKVDVETSAIIVSNQNPNFDEDVLHLTVRRSRTVEEKLFFELDYYDFHFINRETSIENSFIWKSNLLGGGRLSYLLQRLRGFRTLGKFTTAKTISDGWDIRQGYRTGKHKKCVPATFISEHKIIRSDNFYSSNFDLDMLPKDVLFDSPKSESLFTPPNLLIRRVVNSNHCIPNHIIDFYAPFDENIVGIHVKQEDLFEIENIKSYLDRFNQTLSFFALVNESRFFLHTTTSIGKKDIMALPYPKNVEELELNYAETILRDDVLNYRIEQLYKGEDAKINALTTPKEMEAFGEVYCLALNSFGSKDGRNFCFSKLWETPSVFVAEFKLLAIPVEFEIEKKDNFNIQSLLQFEDNSRNFNIQRIIRHYTQDAVYLVKPKQLRYWLKSIALRDADETLNDFIVLEK